MWQQDLEVLSPEGPRDSTCQLRVELQENLQCVNGRGCFGEQIAGGHPGGTRKCLQGEHFVRCCHRTHRLFFRGFPGVAVWGGGGGLQQFATQTLHVHLLSVDP